MLRLLYDRLWLFVLLMAVLIMGAFFCTGKCLKSAAPLYYSHKITEDLKSFPIDEKYCGEYSYYDTFGEPRTYGGNRSHMGTDIMDNLNIRGRIEVLSMTDGVVEKKGWNEKGGYRIGIRSKNNIYYYYAHLDTFADDIQEGSDVSAGDFLGYMGDSGYGRTVGTKGRFPVHLHIGISPKQTDDKGELWVNPYAYLKRLEGK